MYTKRSTNKENEMERELLGVLFCIKIILSINSKILGQIESSLYAEKTISGSHQLMVFNWF